VYIISWYRGNFRFAAEAIANLLFITPSTPNKKMPAENNNKGNNSHSGLGAVVFIIIFVLVTVILIWVLDENLPR
jgi:hypothetical protein